MQLRGDRSGRAFDARTAWRVREDGPAAGSRDEVDRPALVRRGTRGGSRIALSLMVPPPRLRTSSVAWPGLSMTSRLTSDGVVTITCRTESAAAAEIAAAARATITAARNRDVAAPRCPDLVPGPSRSPGLEPSRPLPLRARPTSGISCPQTSPRRGDVVGLDHCFNGWPHSSSVSSSCRHGG
jgi:hypothetical protein